MNVFSKAVSAASASEAEKDDESGVVDAAFTGDEATPLLADADANEGGNTGADEDANDRKSKGVREEEEEEEEAVETFRRPKYSIQLNREGSPGTIKFTTKMKPMSPSADSPSFRLTSGKNRAATCRCEGRGDSALRSAWSSTRKVDIGHQLL